MDYEEMMLQVTDVLKANNRYRLGDFEQAVKLIREITTPKGKWLPVTTRGETWDVKCSLCGEENDLETDYCPKCGAKMEG